MGDARSLGYVRDGPERIGWRLDPDEPRAAGPDRGPQGGVVARIDKRRLHTVARCVLQQPLAQAPVHGLRRNDVCRALQREKSRRRGGHAGGEQKGGGAFLKLGQNVLGLAHCGVVGAAVAVTPPVLVVRIPDESGRDVNGRNDGAGCSVDGAACLRGDRLRLQAGRGAWLRSSGCSRAIILCDANQRLASARRRSDFSVCARGCGGYRPGLSKISSGHAFPPGHNRFTKITRRSAAPLQCSQFCAFRIAVARTPMVRQVRL